MSQLRPGVYRHYKGQEYQVFRTVRHSETEEELVLYRCLYGDFSWWVRPQAMFRETVVVAGEECPRFAWQRTFYPDSYPDAPPLAAEGLV
ncbi:DUF1653 domain-containing protein [Pseudomaricurvus sp. HS19]|uniref:DUF1653 domain-containing protein n=1 Tax=Pseudomaricurvus sp. HS19 TaxID=2692626 RepID=UPI00136C5AED|nr:DUF1653 domain-containing protein [Pseudomaricurvus sp. HS19]MYM62147.1 DUF1653 domain-containing protein [Pseudomaricurvus sp. HS19]